MNIKEKHDFILYKKDEGIWYNRILSPITLGGLNSPNLQPINSKMGFRQLYPD